LGSIPPESNDDLDQLSSTNAAEVALPANPDWAASVSINRFHIAPLATGAVGGGNGTRVFGAWSKARDFRYETFVAADHREGPHGF
jgi:hypothetical protein